MDASLHTANLNYGCDSYALLCRTKLGNGREISLKKNRVKSAQPWMSVFNMVNRCEVDLIRTYIKYGRVIFFSRAGFFAAYSFHSSMSILPSRFVSVSVNV